MIYLSLDGNVIFLLGKKFYVFSEATNVLLSALKKFSARLHVISLPLLSSQYSERTYFSFCLSSFSKSLPFQFHPVFLVLFILFYPSNYVTSFNFFLFFCTPKYTSKNHMDACYHCYDVLPVYVVTTLITSSLACQLSGVQ